jgi:CubicO group peptidase (beta-lactamase class C family)
MINGIVTITVFLLTVASITASAQVKTLNGPDDPKELEQFLDSFFAEQMQREHIPGAAFIFVKNNQVFFKKGYGWANLDRKIPFSPDSTIFRIGSISKVFTADAILQLADRGKLDLHADVNLYLKQFKIPQTFPDSVTAAHLISHTAGFDEIRPGTQAPTADSVLPLSNFLQTRLVRLWRPGQIPMYSTYGITLAGLVVEDISGMSFESYLLRNIWQPLGMTRTSITVPAALSSDVAIGYEYRDGSYDPQSWEWYHTTPASSINSSAADIAKWMIAHLQKGVFGNVRILSEKAVRDMFVTHATGHPRLHGISYGFEEEAFGDLTMLQHGGNMAGFSSLVVLIPKYNAGFFVVTHGENSQLRENLKWALLVRYYSLKKFQVPQPAPTFNSRAHLFVGRYGLITYCHTCPGRQPTFILNVSSKPDGTLWLNGRRWIEVEPLLFVRDDGASRIAFRADAAGRITHMFSGGSWVFEKLIP